jgi:molybdenum cofactor biosynthesis enzyme MoaA
MVVLKGINDDEIADFLAYVRNRSDLILQIIEHMELQGCGTRATTAHLYQRPETYRQRQCSIHQRSQKEDRHQVHIDHCSQNASPEKIQP